MGYQSGVPVADDDAYQQALKRREEILTQLQTLQNELRDVDGFVTLYERLFPRAGAGGKPQGGDVGNAPPGRRQRNILPPARLADLCCEIIAARGQPMTRSELLAVIEARGIPLAGRDPSKNLGTILWRRQDLFENVLGRGYWVRSMPLPAEV